MFGRNSHSRQGALGYILQAAIVTGAAAPATSWGAEALVAPPSAEAMQVDVAALAGGAKVIGGGAAPVALVEVTVPLARTPSGLPLALLLPLRSLYRGETNGDINARSKLDLFGFELAPALRLVVPLTAKLLVNADVGGGVVHWAGRRVTDEKFFGRSTRRVSHTGGVVRFGLGLDVAVWSGMRLALEPLRLSCDFDGGADWSFLGGVRLPL